MKKMLIFERDLSEFVVNNPHHKFFSTKVYQKKIDMSQWATMPLDCFNDQYDRHLFDLVVRAVQDECVKYCEPFTPYMIMLLVKQYACNINSVLLHNRIDSTSCTSITFLGWIVAALNMVKQNENIVCETLYRIDDGVFIFYPSTSYAYASVRVTDGFLECIIYPEKSDKSVVHLDSTPNRDSSYYQAFLKHAEARDKAEKAQSSPTNNEIDECDTEEPDLSNLIIGNDGELLADNDNIDSDVNSEVSQSEFNDAVLELIEGCYDEIDSLTADIDEIKKFINKTQKCKYTF